MATRRAATLADVAALAGVSVPTASKALNDRPQVSPATRWRVLQAAEELSFRPNSLARSLISGRTGTIGLVTHDLDGRFSIPILLGVEDAAGAGKMSALLCDARGDKLREQHHLDTLMSRRVDGLVVVGARPDPRSGLGTLAVPVVYAYAPSTAPEDMSVTVNHVQGGRLAARHLMSCGRSRIAIVSGDSTYGAARERAQGAEAELREGGLEPWNGRPVFGSWSEQWGRAAVELLLAGAPGFDAVLCGSDQIARGVLDALREHGITVPREVSVIGHDNWSIIAEGSRPSLSTIDMQLEQVGRHAAERLFAAIEGHGKPGVETVDSTLVLRESSVPVG